MIERLYVTSLLGFEQVELEFAPGLVVFSGPSGAGKSVLIGSILAGFGLADGLAAVSEMELERPADLHSDLYPLEAHPVIKLIRKNTTRCYIDGQNIPRKGLAELFRPYVHYLSVRDRGGFESERLIGLIDTALAAADGSYAAMLRDYRDRYGRYRAQIERRAAIRRDEAALAERIAFATYEIEKIRAVDPQEGELEALLATKRQLSRLEKMNEAIERVARIFEAEGAVEALYGLLEREGSYFSDAINQLRADMDAARELAETLAETDVASVLDRLEQLNALVKRHGTIAEAWAYCAAKEAELAGYSRIEADKEALDASIAAEEATLGELAGAMTRRRTEQSQHLAARMNGYLRALKLPEVSFAFASEPLGERGADRVDLVLDGAHTAILSGGEHNRLRLALMATALSGSTEGSGVVILDEIDANVSGDESIAIAAMIADLAQSRQVFAISHQPHLAAQASQHILVAKTGSMRYASVLDGPGRVREVARIVGGETADAEAIAFAQKLVGKS